MQKYDDYWKTLELGFISILENDKITLYFEKLYRAAYFIVVECNSQNKLIDDIDKLLLKYGNLLDERKSKMMNDIILYLTKSTGYKIEFTKKENENEPTKMDISI